MTSGRQWKMLGLPLIEPDWKLPPGVKAVVTTRDGGVSEGKFGNFNLSHVVGDSEMALGENRMRLQGAMKGSPEIAWLTQVHSDAVVEAREAVGKEPYPEADGSWTDGEGIACAVLTADCVPVLLAADDGSVVAAAHAGWRGLAAGVIASAAQEFKGLTYTAYLGPCISQAMYVVGEDVWGELRSAGATDDMAHRGEEGKFHVSLAKLAMRQLHDCKARTVKNEDRCTFLDGKNFFSARRDGKASGRFVTAIWKTSDG